MIINKRNLGIIFIVLLVVGGIIFLTTMKSEKDEDNQQETIPIEDPETEEKITDNEKDDEELEQEEDPVSEQFKDLIVDAVKSTVDFFFKKGVHVVAIGDSLTQGVGDGGHGGYIDILDRTVNEEEDKVEFDNFGKRGNRTDQLLKRLEEPEISKAIIKADIILMTIGANDIMQVVKENFTNITYDKFELERVHFENRLNDIFDQVRELNSDAEIYLLGLYNPFEMYFNDIEELDMIVDDWNDTEKIITEKDDHATFVPIKDLFDETDINLFAEDHFHPNRLGYHRMAKRVLEYVTEQER